MTIGWPVYFVLHGLYLMHYVPFATDQHALDKSRSSKGRWALPLQVSFQLENDPDNAEMVAWTTTPWCGPTSTQSYVGLASIAMSLEQSSKALIHVRSAS